MIGNKVLETTQQTEMDAEQNFVVSTRGDTELFVAFGLFSLKH